MDGRRKGLRRTSRLGFIVQHRELDIVVVVDVLVVIPMMVGILIALVGRVATGRAGREPEQEHRRDHTEQRDERGQQHRLRHRRGERLVQERRQRAPTPSPRGAPPRIGGISALIRDVMNAAMLALPSTEPTCRVVL